MNPDTQDAVSYLEGKRDLAAPEPEPGRHPEGLDELIAEYRMAPG